MAWVYIPKTKSGKYYVGGTSDIDRRISQHKAGNTKTTKRLEVEAVVLAQEFPTLKQARAVEAKIKKLKRRDYIEKILKDGYIRISPP